MSHAHKRKSARKPVAQVIMVTNSFSGESIGRVGNLSNEGVMLLAPKELPEEHYYQIGFSLGPANNNKIEVGIQSLWCDQAKSANSYWVGCKIIDISPEDAELLHKWVELASETVR